MERFVLERESAEVEVCGRRFRLQEMSGAELREYNRRQIEMSESAVRDLAEDESIWGDSHDSVTVLSAAAEKMAGRENAFFRWLLRNHEDGGAPADDVMLESLTPRQRLRLLEVQDNLNGTKELLGKQLDLFAMAQARRRTRETLASAGQN